MKKLYKKSVVKDWRRLDRTRLHIPLSRPTYFSRVREMIGMGLAYDDGGDLHILAMDKIIAKEGIEHEHFQRISNCGNISKKIKLKIIDRGLTRQKQRLKFQQENATTSRQNFAVSHVIGNEIKTYTDVPDFSPNYSCIGIAKMFGYSSSYSGWRILKDNAENLNVIKRYISPRENWTSPNATYKGVPIAFVNLQERRPIASIIEVKLPKCKKGVAGLNNPKFRVAQWINSLYGDTWD